jgi:hypothetical protein
MYARNIAAHLREEVGIHAQNASAGTINGPAIDRMPAGGAGFNSVDVLCFRGTDAGGASPATAQFFLEDSADGSTGWAVVQNRTPGNPNGLTNIQTAAISTDDSLTLLSADLSGARRYIRVRCVVTLTGGTSPTCPVAAAVILGGGVELP